MQNLLKHYIFALYVLLTLLVFAEFTKFFRVQSVLKKRVQ